MNALVVIHLRLVARLASAVLSRAAVVRVPWVGVKSSEAGGEASDHYPVRIGTMEQRSQDMREK